jgi:hypothetical protein
VNRLWNSLYAKVRSMVKGYVVGGGLAYGVTEILGASDTTDLSSTEKALYSLGATALLGLISAYRKSETGPVPAPTRPLGPGEPEPLDLSDH